MKRSRGQDPSKELLVEQALKLSPSERFQYALGLAALALRANPDLMEHRLLVLRRQRTRLQRR